MEGRALSDGAARGRRGSGAPLPSRPRARPVPGFLRRRRRAARFLPDLLRHGGTADERRSRDGLGPGRPAPCPAGAPQRQRRGRGGSGPRRRRPGSTDQRAGRVSTRAGSSGENQILPCSRDRRDPAGRFPSFLRPHGLWKGGGDRLWLDALLDDVLGQSAAGPPALRILGPRLADPARPSRLASASSRPPDPVANSEPPSRLVRILLRLLLFLSALRGLVVREVPPTGDPSGDPRCAPPRSRHRRSSRSGPFTEGIPMDEGRRTGSPCRHGPGRRPSHPPVRDLLDPDRRAGLPRRESPGSLSGARAIPDRFHADERRVEVLHEPAHRPLGCHPARAILGASPCRRRTGILLVRAPLAFRGGGLPEEPAGALGADRDSQRHRPLAPAVRRSSRPRRRPPRSRALRRLRSGSSGPGGGLSRAGSCRKSRA